MQVGSPDNIRNIVLKDFAPELAAVIQGIYNPSLIESYVHQLLRCPSFHRYQKKTPSTNKNRSTIIRTLAKVTEGLFCKCCLNFSPAAGGEER